MIKLILTIFGAIGLMLVASAVAGFMAPMVGMSKEALTAVLTAVALTPIVAPWFD